MKLIDVLTRWFGLTENVLRALIQDGIARFPDHAPKLTELLHKLDEEVDLAGLAAAIPGELKDVLSGHLNPKDHPSDLV